MSNTEAAQQQQAAQAEIEAIRTANKQRLADWSVTNLEFEAQVDFFRENIGSRLVDLIQLKDQAGNHIPEQPQELVVVDSLYNAVDTAMNSMVLPGNAELPPEVQREQAEQTFRQLCSQRILVRSAAPDKLDLLPSQFELVPEASQFVVIVTQGMIKREWLKNFDRQLGLSRMYQSQRIPLTLTYDRLEELAHMYFMFQQLSAQPQLHTAAPGIIQGGAESGGGKLFTL